MIDGTATQRAGLAAELSPPRRRPEARAHLLAGVARALGTALVGAGLLASYASHVEPRWAEVVRIELPLPRLPRSIDGITVAQLSDIHAGKHVPVAQVRAFVAAVNALRPDLVVVTGDMFDRTPESARACARELAAINAPLGSYVIMGNHERRVPPESGETPFRRAGLTVLCNAAHPVRVNGDALWLIGLDDMMTRHGDLEGALHGGGYAAVPEEACKILLVHEPDFVDWAARYPIDLQLSGHTHGGQIRVPGIGPLLLPILGRKYPMGLYRVRDTWLYTNRGVGVTHPPVRLNCRPEITLLTLRTADRSQRCAPESCPDPTAS
jgi:predicted MPP superfamily phosphohydrolase